MSNSVAAAAFLAALQTDRLDSPEAESDGS